MGGYFFVVFFFHCFYLLGIVTIKAFTYPSCTNFILCSVASNGDVKRPEKYTYAPFSVVSYQTSFSPFSVVLVVHSYKHLFVLNKSYYLLIL